MAESTITATKTKSEDNWLKRTAKNQNTTLKNIFETLVCVAGRRFLHERVWVRVPEQASST
jgi:hypothetical protein